MRKTSWIDRYIDAGDTLTRFFKILASASGAVLILAVLAATYISYTYDANSLRPHLEELAREQGYTLSIDGDLDWIFFPKPGLSVKHVRWQQVERTRGDIEALRLTIDWVAALEAFNAEAFDSPDAYIKLMGLLDGIGLEKTAVAWAPEGMPVWKFDDIELQVSNISADGDAFPLTVALTTLNNVQIRINAQIAIDSESQQFTMNNLTAEIDTARIAGSLNLDATNTSAVGAVNIQNVDIKRWIKRLQNYLPILTLPDTASDRALTAFGADLEFHFEGNGPLSLSGSVDIDGQNIAVDARGDNATQQLSMSLSAAQFAVSDYLPSLETTRPQKSAPNAALFAPLAPLLLWSGQSQLEISFGQLNMPDYTVTEVYTRATSHQGLIQVTSLNADLFNGQLNAEGSIDLSATIPQTRLRVGLSGIDLAQALPALNDVEGIEGIFHFDVDVQGRGLDLDSVIKSLTGDGSFTALQPRYAAMNIEQAFCNATALLGGVGPTPQNWADGTSLSDVSGEFQLESGNFMLDTLSSGTGNLGITASGKVNLISADYRIRAITQLDGTTSSSNGCDVSVAFQNRAIPFLCTGNLNQQGPPLCLPDGATVRSALKDTAAKKIGKKLFGKDKETDMDVKQLLKGLFN